jgi:DNA-binding PadR family transcriptional regulator
MLYELIILAQLMRYPAHGYLIAKIINDMIGPYAHVSNGRLYPLLAKLEKSGLIALHVGAQKGDRQLRSFAITEAGRKRFHELMMDTTSNPGEYEKVFKQKAAYFMFLKPVERLRLIEHYINYCQAHILHLTAEGEDMAREFTSWGESEEQTKIDGRFLRDVLNVMQHDVAQWEQELAWVKRLRENESVAIQENTMQHSET